MKPSWWHLLFIVLVGYLIGYYFPALGNMSVGKLYARKNS